MEHNIVMKEYVVSFYIYLYKTNLCYEQLFKQF